MSLAYVVPSMVLSALSALAGSVQPADTAPPPGAESPQAVVAGLDKALASGDQIAAFSLISPRYRRELAFELVTSALMTLSFSNPDDWPVTLPPPELEAKRLEYREALALAREAFDLHGLGDLIGKPPLADDVAGALGSRLDRADTASLLAAVVLLLERMGCVLGLEESDSSPPVFDVGPVSGYVVAGNRATAEAASETLEFERIDGRWYLAPPEAAPPVRR